MTPPDLLAALSKATGPDRALDAEIATITGWRYVVALDGAHREWRTPEDRPAALPFYTASIEAALTVVPEGFDWIIGNTNGGLTPHACVGSLKEHFGATPVLSLLIAAICARFP